MKLLLLIPSCTPSPRSAFANARPSSTFTRPQRVKLYHYLVGAIRRRELDHQKIPNEWNILVISPWLILVLIHNRNIYLRKSKNGMVLFMMAGLSIGRSHLQSFEHHLVVKSSTISSRKSHNVHLKTPSIHISTNLHQHEILFFISLVLQV